MPHSVVFASVKKQNTNHKLFTLNFNFSKISYNHNFLYKSFLNITNVFILKFMHITFSIVFFSRTENF